MQKTLLEKIQAARYGTDRDVIGSAVQAGDEWFIDQFLTYTWYRAAAAVLKPASILELGVRFGYSGIALLQGCRQLNPRYCGLDAEADGIRSNAIASANLKCLDPLALVINVNTLNSRMVAEELSSVDDSFDLIHVDGCHSIEGIAAELAIAEEFVSPAGSILIDDCDVTHIYDAAVQLGQKLKVQPILLPTQHGLAVLDLKHRKD